MHLIIHPLPASNLPYSDAAPWNGICSICVTPEQIHTSSFQDSFESAFANLQSISRMFIEPDGSFVWKTHDHQIDGLLFDNQGHLCSIELKGAFGRSSLIVILQCLGVETDRFLVQDVRTGLFFFGQEFLESGFFDKECY